MHALTPLIPRKLDPIIIKVVVVAMGVEHGKVVDWVRALLRSLAALAPCTVKKRQEIDILVLNQILHPSLNANIHTILSKKSATVTLAPAWGMVVAGSKLSKLLHFLDDVVVRVDGN